MTVPADQNVMFDVEALRQHIQVQLERIAAENGIRYDLLQAELDGRLSTEQTARLDLKALLDERNLNIQTSYNMIQQEVDRRFRTMHEQIITGQQTAKEAVTAALNAADKAVKVAQEAAEKRLDSVNEFRQQLGDQTATFITRNEVGLIQEQNRADNTRNADRIGAMELRLQGFTGGQDTRDKVQQDTRQDNTFEQYERIARAQGNRQVIAMSISGLAALISIVAVIVVIVLHSH